MKTAKEAGCEFYPYMAGYAYALIKDLLRKKTPPKHTREHAQEWIALMDKHSQKVEKQTEKLFKEIEEEKTIGKKA